MTTYTFPRYLSELEKALVQYAEYKHKRGDEYADRNFAEIRAPKLFSVMTADDLQQLYNFAMQRGLFMTSTSSFCWPEPTELQKHAFSTLVNGLKRREGRGDTPEDMAAELIEFLDVQGLQITRKAS